MILRIYRNLKRRSTLYFVNRVFSGTNPHYFDIKRRLLNSIGFSIGSGTKIVGPIICTGSLTVGSNCWIGTKFTVHGNGKVIIGNNVDLGPEVTALTGSHLIGASEHRAGHGFNCTIEINDGCWIGAKSVLLNSICINKGAVIAAGAVVCKDISENVLAGGVPAKTIKMLGDD